MSSAPSSILILGAGGYLGESTVREALAARLRVFGLVRREEAARRIRALGGVALLGDASEPATWKHALAGIDVVVDLVQPPLPKRITRRALEAIARTRVAITREVSAAIAQMDANERPVYLSVGGCDELAPDANGILADGAPLRIPALGGGRIGLPVHRALGEAGIASASVYLGVVYGPGKAFASTLLPRLRAGSLPIIGSGRNRLPLIHVEDAARALVHVSGLGKARISGRSFVAAHPCGSTANQFFNAIAAKLGARSPRHLPGWLVGLVAGAGAVELMTVDGRVVPSALLESGFTFRYASLESGIEAMVRAFESGTRG